MTSLRSHLLVISPRQHCPFQRNVAAVVSRWQSCVPFDRAEIWTSNLSLQRRMRYRSTNWSVEVLASQANLSLIKNPSCSSSLTETIQNLTKFLHLHYFANRDSCDLLFRFCTGPFEEHMVRWCPQTCNLCSTTDSNSENLDREGMARVVTASTG